MGASQGSPRYPDSFAAFFEQVALANTVAQRYRDPNGRYMSFNIDNKDEGDSMFWKQVVRVEVTIVNPRGKREGPHHLSVKQFYAILRTLQDHMTAAEFTALANSGSGTAPPLATTTATRKSSSTASATPGGPVVEADPDVKECPICMDASPDIILPCAHAFCKRCLGQWSGKSAECPLCRQAQGDEDEQWVLANEPSPAQIGAHLLRFLASLTSKR